MQSFLNEFKNCIIASNFYMILLVLTNFHKKKRLYNAADFNHPFHPAPYKGLNFNQKNSYFIFVFVKTNFASFKAKNKMIPGFLEAQEQDDHLSFHLQRLGTQDTQIDRQIERSIERQIDRQIDRRIYIKLIEYYKYRDMLAFFPIILYLEFMDIELRGLLSKKVICLLIS